MITPSLSVFQLLDDRRKDRLAALLISGFFLAHVAVRVLSGHPLTPDESEAFLYGRELHIGYPAQPPFFYWLQWGMFQVLGVSVLSISLTKHAIQIAFNLLFYRLLRLAFPPQLSLLALASVLLMPTYAIEAQSTLNHTPTVLLATMLVLNVVWRLTPAAGIGPYLWLGLAMGMGFLSRYTFSFLPLALPILALLQPALRKRISARKLVLSLAVTLLVIAPNGLWILSQPQIAVRSIWKLQAGAPVLLTFASFLSGLLALYGPAGILLLFLWALGRNKDNGAAGIPPAQDQLRHFLVGTGIIMLGLLMITLIAGRMALYQTYWLLPLGYVVIPSLVLFLAPHLRYAARLCLTLICTLAALGSLIATPIAAQKISGIEPSEMARLLAKMEEVSPGYRTILTLQLWLLGNAGITGNKADLIFWNDHPPGPCPGIVVVQGPPEDILRDVHLTDRASKPTQIALQTDEGTRTFWLVPYAKSGDCPARQ